MVEDKSEPKMVKVVDDHKCSRNTSTWSVITITETKDYKIVFDKRVMTGGFATYPYDM